MAAFLATTTLAQAGPLDLHRISADAKWAAHVDVEALVTSTIARKAKDELLTRRPDAEAYFLLLRNEWKFDPTTDLQDVTIYGTQVKKGTGVAIVHARFDEKLLLERVSAAPEHRTSSHGKFELHTWTHALGSKHQRSMTAALFTPQVMVFGASSEEVMAALDVLDGTKPSFADKGLSLNGEIPAGAILVAGLADVGNIQLPCKSPILKQADSFIASIGETEGNAFVQGKLTVKTPETAKELKKVVDGFLALAILSHSDDSEILRLLGNVQVSESGNAVTIECHGSAEAIWNAAQREIGKKKTEIEEWRHGKSDCPKDK